MALSSGTRLDVYEVVGGIGAGGMGEVYRARDTRLQRHVAIKVLPDLFARDPERLARFEREAVRSRASTIRISPRCTGLLIFRLKARASRRSDW